MAGVVTYYTFDLMTGTLLAELPLTGVTWGKRLNAAGPFAGTLDLADPKVKKLQPANATPTGRTMLIVDVDGAIEWGGVIWTRNPIRTATAKTLTLGGVEFESYFTSRVQAADYSSASVDPGSLTYWNPVGGAAADACYIGAQIIYDAIRVSGSALSTMAINIIEATSNPNPIVESYPIAQLQTVDSILTGLAAGGYGTGFDFGFDVSWSNGQGILPVVTLNINYPRRGRIAGSTGLVISEPITEYSWPEDATQQGNNLYGSASTASLVAQVGPDETVLSAGWPLLDQSQSFSNINTQSALNAAVAGSLAQLEWPLPRSLSLPLAPRLLWVTS